MNTNASIEGFSALEGSKAPRVFTKPTLHSLTAKGRAAAGGKLIKVYSNDA